MAAAIDAVHLAKAYGTVHAVRDVSFSVEEGTLFGILGPNGSGKTTMNRILTGQIRPTSGGAQVLGVDVLRDPLKVREIVGIVPEQESPPSFLTAEEYLHFVASIRHLDRVDGRCAAWFKRLEFEDKANVLCKDLSRGTRQKLMIAQAFLHEPTLVLIDEPLINLDPIMQRRVKDFLVSYVRAGNTVFISTHILEIAQGICDRVGILSQGSLRYEGPVQEIRDRGENLEDFFMACTTAA
jgi:ABC-2 type transport system ATP-binding protein